MAITQTISSVPNAGKRGVDLRDVFVTKQESFQDHLSDVFIIEINNFKTQLNATETNINNKEISCSSNATSAATNAALTLGYKNDAQASFNQFMSLLSGYVIPTEAINTRRILARQLVNL